MTKTSFAFPGTSQERDGAAKFQPDRPSGLAGEVVKGDRMECKLKSYIAM